MSEKTYETDELVDELEIEETDGLETDEQNDETGTISQSMIDKLLDRRLARERAQQEKRLKKIFGTTNLQEAGEYFQAGKAVATSAGVTPRVVLDRLSGQLPQGTVGGTASDPVRAELAEIRSLLQERDEAEARTAQEEEARKEFGKLYEENRYEIDELAEEKNLTIPEAAAIVLRPHLKSALVRQTTTQKTQRRGAIVSSDAPAKTDGDDGAGKLTPAQLQVARKMGIPPAKYYKRLKEMGKID